MNPKDRFLWYTLYMRSRAQRLLMIVLALFFWSAPFAQAWVPATGMPCAMKAESGLSAVHPCCGSACDCTLENQKNQVPYTVVDRTENAPVRQLFNVESAQTFLPEEPVAATAPEESPPKESPLYEIYSEYRL